MPPGLKTFSPSTTNAFINVPPSANPFERIVLTSEFAQKVLLLLNSFTKLPFAKSNDLDCCPMATSGKSIIKSIFIPEYGSKAA